MKLYNGKDSLEFVKDGQQIQVTLAKTQYDKTAMSTIRNYLQVTETEDTLVVTYTLPDQATVFTQETRLAKTRLERLQLAEKLSQLVDFTHRYQIPYLHPENLFLEGEHFLVLHSGLEGIVVPYAQDDTLFLDNLKALTLSLFLPKVSYDKILAGLSAFNDKFLQKMVQSETSASLFALIRQELVLEKEKVNATKRLVSKTVYQFYRFIALVSVIVAVTSGGFWYQTYRANQKQVAITTAQTSFMTTNYAKTQTDLEKYEPNALPNSAKYVLAVSSINLSDLTTTQKQAILNTVSIKSDDNTLDYWVYMGRGQFEKALNLAQNLGDDQLTLLTYTDLYQATKLNDKMDGAKKQKLLTDYSKQIEDLTKKLGK